MRYRQLAVLVAAVMVCTSAAVGAANASGTMARHAAATAYPSGPVAISMTWWGETEVPGAQKWLKGVEAAYEKLHPNVKVTDTLVSTDALIPKQDATCKARSGPTIQYMWGGATVLQPAWKNCIVPISDYLGASEVKHYLARQEDSFGGKVWSAAWYAQPGYVVVYNKATFKKVGVNPTSAFGSWSGLLKACDAFNAKGTPLFGMGFKDQWGFGRPWETIQDDQLNSMAQVLSAVVGTTSFVSAPYIKAYTRLQELNTHHCYPDDLLSVDMYPAQQRMLNGKAGATMTTGTETAGYAKTLGKNLGVALLPTSGTGKLAGRIGVTAQTLGITSWASPDQRTVAADFIAFMHKPAQLTSFYKATGAAPADDRFNLAAVKTPQMRQIYAWMIKRPRLLVENFTFGWGIDTTTPYIKLLTGDLKTPTQVAAGVEKSAAQFRAANQLEVQRLKELQALAAKQGF